MSIDAHAGPIGTFRSNLLGSIGTGSANENPEAGPCFFHLGQGLLDSRVPFTYQPGQNFGAQTSMWLANSKLQCVDQVPSALSFNNIATSAQAVSGTPITLVTSSGGGITVSTSITRADTGATVTGLLAIDTAMATVAFGQAGTIQPWDPTKAISRAISVTTNGDDSGATYTVAGYDVYGYPMSEAITGPNNTTAYGKKAFKYVASVTPSGTINSTSTTIGTSDIYGLPLVASRIPYVEAWWGAQQTLITGPGGTVTSANQEIVIPVPALASVTNNQVYEAPIPFPFTVIRVEFIQTVATTTGSKAATFTAGINGTAMTGGVISVTSNAATGIIFPGTNITGKNTSPTYASVVTTPIASPGLVNWPNHGLVAGTPVVFAGAGLPTGITAGTTYYVISAGLATNAFEISTTSGGSAQNFTGTSTGTQTATALNMLSFTASSVTAFSEGAGNLVATVQNNALSGGTFTAAVTTQPATTTTGDVRGTLATPDNSDGVKRLTIFQTVSVANTLLGVNGISGVTQNTSSNNGS
jgi:hypothetical protein